MAGEEITMP